MDSSVRLSVILGGIDADAVLWAAAVTAASGTVSAARLKLVSRFIRAEKSCGAWAQTDDYSAFWGENAAQSLVSIKQRRLATAVNSPTFTANRDYTFNGSTNYINTGFIPGTHAVAMDGNNQRIAAYIRNDVSAATSTAGVQNSATQNLSLVARNTTTFSPSLNGGFSGAMAPSATSTLGYIAASRAAGSLTMLGYKNGAAVGTSTIGAVGNVLPTLAVFVGCRNNAGSPTFFRADAVGLLCMGAPLSPTQEAAQYSNVQAWATAIEANI